MSNFSLDFTTDDFETLQDALTSWESLDDSFLEFARQLEMIPPPPEEFVEKMGGDEFLEAWSRYKKEVKNRSLTLIDRRKERSEKSVFIRAKLITKRKELIDKLSDDLFNAPEVPPQSQPPKSDLKPPQQQPQQQSKINKPKQTYGNGTNEN